jgi:tetratricopeptide (TPR) repeat protein
MRSSFQQAEYAYNRALLLKPDFALAQYRRGILYWRELHDYPRAIADLSVVLDQFSEAIFIRGMAHQAVGDYQLAVNDLQAFIDAAPNSRYYANANRQLRLIQAILDEIPPQLGEGGLPLLKA